MQGIKRLLFVVAVLFTTSCSFIKTVSSNPTVVGIIDCAKAETTTLAQKILGEVSTILATGGSDWKNQLLDLAKDTSNEALACAVKQVTTDFEVNVAAAPNARNSSKGATNGEAFLKEQGYTFTQ